MRRRTNDCISLYVIYSARKWPNSMVCSFTRARVLHYMEWLCHIGRHTWMRTMTAFPISALGNILIHHINWLYVFTLIKSMTTLSQCVFSFFFMHFGQQTFAANHEFSTRSAWKQRITTLLSQKEPLAPETHREEYLHRFIANSPMINERTAQNIIIFSSKK